MATKLTKTVVREYVGRQVTKDQKGKPLIVELHPGGFIRFRVKRRRKGFDLDLGTAYLRAAQIDAAKAKITPKARRSIRRGTLAMQRALDKVLS